MLYEMAFRRVFRRLLCKHDLVQYDSYVFISHNYLYPHKVIATKLECSNCKFRTEEYERSYLEIPHMPDIDLY